ncbi:hypothetical protein KCU77_g14434, partial [Aureobasidium melanogenum]
MSIYITIFENVVRFSIKHIGAERTYDICTTLILLYARVKQAHIAMAASSSVPAYLIIPAIASIIISLTASSTHMRIGPPLVMLVILLLAMDAERAPYRLSC